MLRVGEVGRTDGDHFHRVMMRRRAWNHDHRADPPKAREGQTLDHFLVGHDLVRTRSQYAIDALNSGRMLEGDRLAPRASRHKAAMNWGIRDSAPLIAE